MNREEKYKITDLSSKCDEPMILLPDSNMHDAIKKQMQNLYHVWFSKEKLRSGKN